MSSTGRCRPRALLHHRDLPLPVEIHPVSGARRLRLRLDQRRGVLKLTGPLRMNRGLALGWAAEQRQWVQTQLAEMLPDEPFEPGAVIPLDGLDVELDWVEAEPRTPRLASRRLVCGGPREGFARRVETFLRRFALETLSRETAEAAARANARVFSVGVGDAETRWGSCSASGRIRYSWRLILAPPAARRYVVAHEVAHLVHLHHGPPFKALERELFEGDADEARLLLRSAGPRLRRFGRGH
jgi:predicted metal-dependent hydrolase